MSPVELRLALWTVGALLDGYGCGFYGQATTAAQAQVDLCWLGVDGLGLRVCHESTVVLVNWGNLLVLFLSSMRYSVDYIQKKT